MGPISQATLIREVLENCNIAGGVSIQVQAIIMALLKAYNNDINKVKEQYDVGKKIHILKLIEPTQGFLIRWPLWLIGSVTVK